VTRTDLDRKIRQVLATADAAIAKAEERKSYRQWLEREYRAGHLPGTPEGDAWNKRYWSRDSSIWHPHTRTTDKHKGH
jgi:hypothetical protein